MSLRPRYSLLTLLVLMALAAGGIKLWRGPHWASEWRTPTRQIEYGYTNSLQGQRIAEGLRIERIYHQQDERLEQVAVSFYRAGQLVPRSLYVLSADFDLHDVIPSAVDLSNIEDAEVRRAVEQEMQNFTTRGITAFGIVHAPATTPLTHQNH